MLMSPHMHRLARRVALGRCYSTKHTTHFGYKEVPTETKESLVKGVFSSVAASYDLMNDAMSFGIHRLWKDDFVAGLNPGNPNVGVKTRCIDVAGGTGDIALRILDWAREKHADRDLTVDMVDINPAMLEEGRRRFRKTMYHHSRCPSLSRSWPPLIALAQLRKCRFMWAMRNPCQPSQIPMIYTRSLSASATALPYQTSSAKHTECSGPEAPLPA